MSLQAINCNYARTAIRCLVQKQQISIGNAKRLTCKATEKVVTEYNSHFVGHTPLQLRLAIAQKRIPELLATFNKWHPQNQKERFLETFSLTAWKRLPADKKQAHSLQNCTPCQQEHLSLSRAFPDKQSRTKLQSHEPLITFNRKDLSSPTQCGRKALKQLDAICQENFHKSIQTVLTETPRSKLVLKPSSQTRQSERRRIVRATKGAIQQSMDSMGAETVMKNRISWRKYDKFVRKVCSLHQYHHRHPVRAVLWVQTRTHLQESTAQQATCQMSTKKLF